MDIKTVREDLGRTLKVEARFQDHEIALLGKAIYEHIVREVARQFVAENYTEIAKHIDVQAIAQLSIARGAVEVSNAIKETQPPRIVTEHHTEVYQRGLFGGVTRIK